MNWESSLATIPGHPDRLDCPCRRVSAYFAYFALVECSFETDFVTVQVAAVVVAAGFVESLLIAAAKIGNGFEFTQIRNGNILAIWCELESDYSNKILI